MVRNKRVKRRGNRQANILGLHGVWTDTRGYLCFAWRASGVLRSLIYELVKFHV